VIFLSVGVNKQLAVVNGLSQGALCSYGSISDSCNIEYQREFLSSAVPWVILHLSNI